MSYSIIALHNLCRQGYTLTNATRLGLYFLASTLMYTQFSRWLTTNPPICDGIEEYYRGLLDAFLEHPVSHGSLKKILRKDFLSNCPRSDSNRHTSRHKCLKLACLPISSQGLTGDAFVVCSFREHTKTT